MNLLGVTDNRMNELRVAGWRWVDKFLFIEKRRLGFLGRINGSSNGSLKSGSFARSSFANSSVLPHFLVSILLSLRALFLFRPRALLLALPLLTCGGSPTAWALPAPTDGFANYPTKLSVLLGKVPGNVAANASAYLLPYGTRATPQLACQQIIGDGGAALFSAQTGASVTPTSTVLAGQAPEFQCAASFRFQFNFAVGMTFDQGPFNFKIWPARVCVPNATAVASGATDSCQCDAGYQEDPTHTSCEKVEVDMCTAAPDGLIVGNPILPGTREKYRFEEDLVDGGTAPLSFARIYRSAWGLDAARAPTGLGPAWTHSHDMTLRMSSPFSPTGATVTDPEGTAHEFTDVERVGHAYVYDEQSTLMGEYGAGGAQSAGSRHYIWLPTPAGPMPVATVENTTSIQAITADHLNTPRRVTSADGTLLWQWPYSEG